MLLALECGLYHHHHSSPQHLLTKPLLGMGSGMAMPTSELEKSEVKKQSRGWRRMEIVIASAGSVPQLHTWEARALPQGG